MDTDLSFSIVETGLALGWPSYFLVFEKKVARFGCLAKNVTHRYMSAYSGPCLWIILFPRICEYLEYVLWFAKAFPRICELVSMYCGFQRAFSQDMRTCECVLWFPKGVSEIHLGLFSSKSRDFHQKPNTIMSGLPSILEHFSFGSILVGLI